MHLSKDIPLFQVLGFRLGMCKQASVLETCVQYGGDKGRQVGALSKKKQGGTCITWHQYLPNDKSPTSPVGAKSVIQIWKGPSSLFTLCKT